jgi:serine/threonine-protein kinase
LAQRAIPSLIGKLATLAVVAVAFTFALFGTIWLSLRSPEVKVPEIVGKSLPDAESTLAGAGLNVRTRARRFSAEVKPDTVLDQAPRPGETVKKGQTIAIVLSRAEAKEGESSVGVKKEGADGDENQGGGESAASNTTNASNANNSNNANKPKKSANRNRNATNANSNAAVNSNVNSNLSTNLATNSPAGSRNAEESPSPSRNAGDHNANNRNANATTNSQRNTNTLVIVNPNANAGRSRTVTNANNRNANSQRNANRRPPGV